MGPGTWDLGPGTWDLGPGNRIENRESRIENRNYNKNHDITTTMYQCHCLDDLAGDIKMFKSKSLHALAIEAFSYIIKIRLQDVTQRQMDTTIYI